MKIFLLYLFLPDDPFKGCRLNPIVKREIMGDSTKLWEAV